jgi:hypothetical protein
VDHSVLLLILNVCTTKKNQSTKKHSFILFFAEELKSYRDFDLHHTNELPLSSFIPIPEDKEVGIIDVRYQSLFSHFFLILNFDLRHYHQPETFQKNLLKLHHLKLDHFQVLL